MKRLSILLIVLAVLFCSVACSSQTLDKSEAIATLSTAVEAAIKRQPEAEPVIKATEKVALKEINKDSVSVVKAQSIATVGSATVASIASQPEAKDKLNSLAELAYKQIVDESVSDNKTTAIATVAAAAIDATARQPEINSDVVNYYKAITKYYILADKIKSATAITISTAAKTFFKSYYSTPEAVQTHYQTFVNSAEKTIAGK